MKINDVLSPAEKKLPLSWNNAAEGDVVHKLFSSGRTGKNNKTTGAELRYKERQQESSAAK